MGSYNHQIFKEVCASIEGRTGVGDLEVTQGLGISFVVVKQILILVIIILLVVFFFLFDYLRQTLIPKQSFLEGQVVIRTNKLNFFLNKL